MLDTNRLFVVFHVLLTASCKGEHWKVVDFKKKIFLMCCSQFGLEISGGFSLFFLQNTSEGATEKFQEIQGAYRYLREGEPAFLNICMGLFHFLFCLHKLVFSL